MLKNIKMKIKSPDCAEVSSKKCVEGALWWENRIIKKRKIQGALLKGN